MVVGGGVDCVSCQGENRGFLAFRWVCSAAWCAATSPGVLVRRALKACSRSAFLAGLPTVGCVRGQTPFVCWQSLVDIPSRNRTLVEHNVTLVTVAGGAGAVAVALGFSPPLPPPQAWFVGLVKHHAVRQACGGKVLGGGVWHVPRLV